MSRESGGPEREALAIATDRLGQRAIIYRHDTD